MIASRFINQIETRFVKLLRFPRSGPAREDFRKGLRVVFHHNYAIYYKPTETELIIMRVLHSARDAAAIAEKGGFE